MKTGTYYVLGDTGAERWALNCTPIRITQEVLDNLGENVIRHIYNLTNLRSLGPWYGRVNMSIGAVHYCAATVEVVALPLNIPVALVGGLHVPWFVSSQNYLNMVWSPPPNMNIRLMVSFHDGGMSSAHLIAVDPEGEHWRLPLPNMYEDGKLCHNQRPGGETIIESLNNFLSSFAASRWNTDLYQDTRKIPMESMFRWRADEKGFQQQPMVVPEGKAWTALCEKISVKHLRDWMVL